MDTVNRKNNVESRFYRDQLITAGDLEDFRNELLQELKKLARARAHALGVGSLFRVPVPTTSVRKVETHVFFLCKPMNYVFRKLS